MCVVVVDLLREDEQDVVLAIDVVDSLVYSLSELSVYYYYYCKFIVQRWTQATKPGPLK